jgi:hypothetical protein
MKRNPFLRVKLKSLAEEARIIHIEEMRANRNRDFDLQNHLRDHRIGKVREAARETLLAYQFLRGIPYEVVEKSNSKSIDLSSVLRMIQKYGRKTYTGKDLKNWCTQTKKAA